MNGSFIFNRLKNLVLSPVSEWEVIRNESHNKTLLIRRFAMPLLVVMALSTVVGNAIFASRMIFSAGYVVLVAVAKFAEAFIGMYISALMINELTTSFNSKKDIDVTYSLVIYSLSIYFAASALAYLFLGSYLEILKVFGLYSLYLLWTGSKTMLNTPDDNRVGFVVVSSLIILGVYAILNLVIGRIVSGILGV